MKKLWMLFLSAFCMFGTLSLTSCGGDEKETPEVPEKPADPETPDPGGTTPEVEGSVKK